jgi:hypothetical protein
MRANNKSSRNGDQSILHPNHYFMHGLETSYCNSWSTSVALTKFSWNENLCSKYKILKQIYRSLARVLRKLCHMALTLEIQILWFAISLENKIHSTRLSLALTSPYNIYYKAVVAYKFFQVGYTLLCLLLVLVASFCFPSSLRSWSTFLCA